MSDLVEQERLTDLNNTVDNNVLNEITELIKLANISSERDSPNISFSNGLSFVKTTHAKLEAYQELVTDKDKRISEMHTENQHLKQKVLEQQEVLLEISANLEEERKLKGMGSFERLRGNFAYLHAYFNELVAKMDQEPVNQSDPVSVEKQRKLHVFREEVGDLFRRVKHKLRNWKANQKEMEEELEATKMALERLNGMVEAVQSFRSTQASSSGRKSNMSTMVGPEISPVPKASTSQAHKKRKIAPPALLPLPTAQSSTVVISSTNASDVFKLPSPVSRTNFQTPAPPKSHVSPKQIRQNVDLSSSIPGPSRLAPVIVPVKPKPTMQANATPQSQNANTFVQPSSSPMPPPPPVPIPSTSELISPKKTVGVSKVVATSLPPSHIHHVIHPALPQSQDIPIQEAVIRDIREEPEPSPSLEPTVTPQTKPGNVCGLCGMNFFTLVQLKLHHTVMHGKGTTAPSIINVPTHTPPQTTILPGSPTNSQLYFNNLQGPSSYINHPQNIHQANLLDLNTPEASPSQSLTLSPVLRFSPVSLDGRMEFPAISPLLPNSNSEISTSDNSSHNFSQ